MTNYNILKEKRSSTFYTDDENLISLYEFFHYKADIKYHYDLYQNNHIKDTFSCIKH